MFRWIFLLSLIIGIASSKAQSSRLDSAQLEERYRHLLEGKPEPGVVLDRLWNLYRSNPEALLNQYRESLTNRKSFPNSLVLGYLLCRAGHITEAIELFQKAIDLEPKDARGYVGLGEAFLLNKQYTEAAGIFEKASRLTVDSEQSNSLRIRAGQAWMDANHFEKAVALWETGELDAALHEKLVSVYIAHDLPERALPHLRFLTENGNPEQRIAATKQLANMYESLGDIESASEVMERLLKQMGTDHWQRPEIQREWVLLLERNHRLDDFKQRLEKKSDEHPKDVQTLLLLAAVLEESADMHEEIQTLKKIQQQIPSQAELSKRIAGLALQIGDWEEAGTQLEALAKISAYQNEAMFALADIDLKKGEINSAKQRIEEVLEDTRNVSQQANVQQQAIRFYLGNHLYDDAEILLKKSAQNSGEDQIALAQFLFSRNREAEADQALNAFIGMEGIDNISAYLRVANVLKDKHRLDSALQVVSKAIALDASQIDSFILQAELLAALGQPKKAAEAYRHAYALADEHRQVEVDRRLFQTLAGTENISQNSQHSEKVTLENLIPEPPEQAHSVSPLLTKEWEKIKSKANEDASQSLRAARWAWWLRDAAMASHYASLALKQNPQSLPAHHFLLELARETRQSQVVLEQLYALLKIDSKNKTDILRRIANYKLEHQEEDAAIKMLEQLHKEEPKNIEVLRDLALAQQQTGLWYDALDTWRDACNQAPVSRKHELLDPLLRAMERLGMHQSLMETLEQAMAEETDIRIRNLMLRDLIKYGNNHDLVSWLSQKLEKRSRLEPHDFFYQTALATLLKQKGKDREALQRLVQARYSEEEEATVLPKLVDEATALGDFSLAIRFQRRLLRFAKENDASAQIRLATLQEQALDHKAARETWTRIPRLYPRNIPTLLKVANFFERIGETEQALALYRQGIATDVHDITAQYGLARLAFIMHRNEEALTALRAVLSLTTPVQGSILIPPFESGVRIIPQELSEITTGKEISEINTALRLEAIRLSASLITKDATLQTHLLFRWLWRSNTLSTEKLWALYYGKDGNGLFDAIIELLKTHPDNTELEQALVLTALDLDTTSKLKKWLSADTERYRIVLDELKRYLPENKRHWTWEEVSALFSGNRANAGITWDCAVQFALYGHLREGYQLGERLYREAPIGRISYGLELTRWLVVLGRMEDAKTLLLEIIKNINQTTSPQPLQAIYDYHLLATDSEWKSFSASFNRQSDDLKIRDQLALILINALEGKKADVIVPLKHLIQLRPIETEDGLGYDAENTPEDRYWNFILNTGKQFQAWNLDWVADALWNHALAERTRIQLQGETAQDSIQKIQIRQIAYRLISKKAIPFDSDFLSINKKSDNELFLLSTALEANDTSVLALQIQQILRKRNPMSVGLARHYLELLNTLDDVSGMPGVFALFFKEEPTLLNSDALFVLIQFVVQKLLSKNDIDSAVSLSQTAYSLVPDNLNYAVLYLQSLNKTKNKSEQQSLIEKIQPDAIASSDQQKVIAETLLVLGEKQAAIRMLEKAAVATHYQDTAILKQLIPLQIENGDRFFQTIFQMIDNGKTLQVPQFAKLLLENNQLPQAFALMRYARDQLKGADEQDWFQWQLTALAKQYDPEGYDAERIRLKKTNHSRRLMEYYRTFATAEECEMDWKDGSLEAAVALLGKEEKSTDTFQAVRSFLKNKLSSLTEAELSRIATDLEEKEVTEEAVFFLQRLCLRTPGNEHYFFQLARNYRKLRHEKEYRTTLDSIAARKVFAPDILTSIAHFCEQLGDTESAKIYFNMAFKNVKQSNRRDVAVSMAQFFLKEKNYSEARKALFASAQYQRVSSLEVFADYFIQSNRLANLKDEFADFYLLPLIRDQILIIILRRQFSQSFEAGWNIVLQNKALVMQSDRAFHEVTQAAEQWHKTEQVIPFISKPDTKSK